MAEVTLQSGEVKNLNSAGIQLREKNLKQQGIDPNTQAPQSTGGAIMQAPQAIAEAPKIEAPIQQQPQAIKAPNQMFSSEVKGGVVPVFDKGALTQEDIENYKQTGEMSADATLRLNDYRKNNLPNIGDDLMSKALEEKMGKPLKGGEPVQDLQAIESNKLANESNQETLNSQKEAKATEQFNSLITNGATNQELATFVNKNSQFKEAFNTSIRNSFKTKANAEFFNKYNGASNQDMQSAISGGKMVIGDAQYKLLPESQRARFEQFNATKNAVTITEKTEFTDSEKVTSLESILKEVQGLFSTNLRTKTNELFNSPAIVSATQKLTAKRVEIEALDIKMEDIEDNIRKQFGDSGYSPAFINSAVRDERNALIKEKRLLLSEYNANLGEYNTLKTDATQELEFYKYEDQQNKEIYQTALGLYESRRAEGIRADEIKEGRVFASQQLAQQQAFDIAKIQDAQAFDILKIEDSRAFDLEMAKFEQQNKEIATQKALENSKELYKFQNEIAQGNIKGQWENRYDGLYFLQENGTFEKKINGNVETKDGVSVYTYVGSDGQPVVEYRDITGKTIGASTSGTNLNQKQVNLLNAPAGTVLPSKFGTQFNVNGGKQCGEYINDIFGGEIGSTMGDTYASKLVITNEKTGGVGSIVSWQPNPNGEFAKFGHAGVIVGESEDGKSWDIKSSNMKGDGTISIDRVPKSVIGGYKTTNLYNTPLEQKQYTTAQKKYLETTALEDFSSKKEVKEAAEGLGLTTEDVFAFKANNLDPKKKDELQSVLDGIDAVIGAGKGFLGKGDGLSDDLGMFSALNPLKYLPGTDAADFRAAFKSLESKLTIKNLDLMTGILTDKDLEVLRGASTSLTRSMSEKSFKEEINKIKIAAENSLSALGGLDTKFFTDASGKGWTKEGIAGEIDRLIGTGKMTKEEAKKFIKDNNIKL